MPIKSRSDNQGNYSKGWGAIFGDPKKVVEDDFKGTECPRCGVARGMHTVSSAGRSTTFVTCLNKDCTMFQKPPEVIENCGSRDTFTYRAGANMERAQGERRAAEQASHMGRDPYHAAAQIAADINNDSLYGEVK